MSLTPLFNGLSNLLIYKWTCPDKSHEVAGKTGRGKTSPVRNSLKPGTQGSWGLSEAKK